MMRILRFGLKQVLLNSTDKIMHHIGKGFQFFFSEVPQREEFYGDVHFLTLHFCDLFEMIQKCIVTCPTNS